MAEVRIIQGNMHRGKVASNLLRQRTYYLRANNPTTRTYRRGYYTTLATEHSLQLATQKFEIVLLTRKGINTIVPVNIADMTIETKTSVKYLGLWFDNKLSFAEHIKQACE